MDKQTIDVSNKLAGNVTSVHDQLRKEGLNKLDGGDLGGGSKNGADDDSNSRDRVVEDGGSSSSTGRGWRCVLARVGSSNGA